MDNELSGERSSNPEEMRETLKKVVGGLRGIVAEEQIVSVPADEEVIFQLSEVEEIQLPKRR